MKRSKRLLSIALSLALVVGMIPMFGVTASAAEMCTVTFHNNGHGTLKVESIIQAMDICLKRDRNRP